MYMCMDLWGLGHCICSLSEVSNLENQVMTESQWSKTINISEFFVDICPSGHPVQDLFHQGLFWKVNTKQFWLNLNRLEMDFSHKDKKKVQILCRLQRITQHYVCVWCSQNTITFNMKGLVCFVCFSNNDSNSRCGFFHTFLSSPHDRPISFISVIMDFPPGFFGLPPFSC